MPLKETVYLGMEAPKKKTPAVVVPQRERAGYTNSKPNSAFGSFSKIPYGQRDMSKARGYANLLGSIGQQQLGLANADMARYKKLYGPLEERLVATAEQDPMDLVNQAATDANLTAETSRGAMKRNLSRMGVDPNSGRWAGLEQQWAIARAAAMAGAMTRARRAGSQSNLNRILSALNYGKSLQGEGRVGLGNAAGTALSSLNVHDQWATDEARLGAGLGGGPAAVQGVTSSLQDETNADLGV